MTPPPTELHVLFDWFQSVPGCMDKFKTLHISDEKGDDEIIRNIGISLDIQPSVWEEMTHDERLLTIYKKLPFKNIVEFKEAFPHLSKPISYNRMLKNNGGKRNKSKKPKRRNSRSKRRKTLSKRRR